MTWEISPSAGRSKLLFITLKNYFLKIITGLSENCNRSDRSFFFSGIFYSAQLFDVRGQAIIGEITNTVKLPTMHNY